MIWHETFDKKLGLPRRGDVYAAKFEIPWTNNMLTFKTDHEREIEIGREYQEVPAEFGQCYITKNNELPA